MKISIPKKKYELDFDGTVVTVRRPTLAEQDKFMEMHDKANTTAEMEEAILSLLELVGFERSFLKTLDLDQLASVRELITLGEIKKK